MYSINVFISLTSRTSRRLCFTRPRMPKTVVQKKAKPVKMAIQAPAKISSFPDTPDIGYKPYPSTATQMAKAKRARLAA